MSQELVPISQRWANAAQTAVEEEPVEAGAFISLKGGIMTVGEDPLPGNQMYVVILDSFRERTFYAGRYNAEVAAAPVCYAFARGEDAAEMGPHPSMQDHPEVFVPQATECSKCPANEWGSSDTGKGKACQDRRRLFLLPAGYAEPIKGSRELEVQLFDDPDHYASADLAQLKLPVTSGKEYSKYVHQLATVHGRPPHGVITRVYLEPHAKDQFHVRFEMVDLIPDELGEVILQRNDIQREQPFPAYTPPQEREKPEQSKRGLLGRR
jgi:hypothetical protein